jgi:hypothetical protein
MKSPKLIPLAALAGLVLASTAGARLWSDRSSQSAAAMSTREEAPLEYFLQTTSFSEIENTRALLNALAAQSISAVRIRFESQGDAVSRGRAAEAGLQALESTLAEFEGTEQEFTLINEQLLLLFRAGQPSRWLDVYLKTLYERPTHELVGRNAQRALTLAKETGREQELLAGFHHVTSIPREFDGKLRVEAVLRPGALASRSVAFHEDTVL